jgi:hypothetical protein
MKSDNNVFNFLHCTFNMYYGLKYAKFKNVVDIDTDVQTYFIRILAHTNFTNNITLNCL